jgi:hypothetical protein
LARFSKAFTAEIDVVSVVDETVENGVRIGWVANNFMPFVYRELTCDDGRSAAISFLKDFEKIVARGGIERFQFPVVQDQKIDTFE